MPVPGKRRSSSKLRRTRAHIALKKIHFMACSHCKKNILPHKVCPFCGYYKGKEVIAHSHSHKKEKKDAVKAQ